ncbi:hypothetical protein ACIA5D_21440 [Actinoplanes sp. NPDC051513]|uniref:hypothetical protein n=1 Tax=Actinoplanes sp. NPDC051513 TaxID=3363908 RepID=UPI0037B3489C
MTERPTRPGSVALTAICTGGVLAFVGTTLDWARVTDASGAYYLVRLADFNRVAAPVAVLWLVLAAGGALAARGSSPWASVARIGVMLTASVGSFYLLSLTLLANGSRVLAHAGLTDQPSVVTVRHIIPEAGCLLYVVGLMLVAVGAGITEVAMRGFQPAPPRREGRPVLHRIVLLLGLILAVVAAVLPWFGTSAAGVVLTPTGIDSPPGHHDTETWLVLYRAGVAACLVITVLALVRRRHAPWLRLLGLVVGVAVTVMLLSGYVALSRQTTLQYDWDRIGPGHHLGVVAMLLLTASFATLPSGASEGALPSGASEAALPSGASEAALPSGASEAALPSGASEAALPSGASEPAADEADQEAEAERRP